MSSSFQSVSASSIEVQICRNAGRDIMPIDHLMIKVKDWPKAKAYYTAALKPLGYEPVADWGTGGGFGVAEQLGNIYVKQGESACWNLGS